MRIKILCQNRVGILRDMLNLLVDYGINVARGEVGGEQGNAVYLHCPNLMNLQLQALRPKIEALPGVFELRKVSLMPSERHSLELNALLGALEFPVLSIDMSGAIVAANRAAAQLLGVRVDEVPGMSLSRYAEDFDLPELVRANKARINGLRVKIKGDVFLADIAPLQSEHDDSEALAGAVLTLHRADRVGERIYQVRKQELRGFDSIFQSSKVMAAVVREARRMAPLDAPLLIEGETGTGKELFARAIHGEGASSPSDPFVAFNCGAVSKELVASELFGYVRGAFTGAATEGRLGRFELAHGGTLCLDEIGELPLDLQPYLLRVLEEGIVYRVGDSEPRHVDVRLIAMTNRNLRDEVAAGRFRQDLYYRISVTTVRIPPLRDRAGDTDLLVPHFNDLLARRHDLTPKRFEPAVMDALRRHSWPGNVRELRNVVESLLLMSDEETVTLADLPPDIVPAPAEPAAGHRLDRLERQAIEATIAAHTGNLTSAARELGISRTTLYRKMEQYGLERYQ